MLENLGCGRKCTPERVSVECRGLRCCSGREMIKAQGEFGEFRCESGETRALGTAVLLADHLG
jgi:hypothetical protein